jgi:diguanylate cyclase (GGDEF)-like protein
MRRTITINAITLNDTVNKYALLGLIISLISIISATFIASFQETGLITVEGLIRAQMTNPAIWALDLTPFMFAYWGQSYCYTLAREAEEIIDTKTNSFQREAKKLNKQLIYEKTMDRITELPNYQALCERIETDVIRMKTRCLIIVLKINNFKEINYCLGDLYTDNLLMLFVKKLKKMLLEIYVLKSHNGKSLIARMRQDEFAILLPGFINEDEAPKFVDYVNHYIENSLNVDENIKINTAITLGAAAYPTHGDNAKELIQHATDSIEFARKEGKSYQYFTNKIEQDLTINGQLIFELESAIANKEYQIEYMPYFDLFSKEIISVETSINFSNHHLNVLSHDHELLMRIEFEIVKKINFMLIAEMIKNIAKWEKEGAKLYGQVNLSILDCRNTEVASFITSRLKFHCLTADKIALSFNERKLGTQHLMCPNLLNELAKLGTKITIDDFASEQSPFNYLSKFPVHNVQILPMRINGSTDDPINQKELKGILELSKIFGFEVAIKNIDNQAILDAVKKLGFRVGNGALLGQKMSAEQLEKQLKTPPAHLSNSA